MKGGKNWILSKEINTNRFFWNSHWLEIWKTHQCPAADPNGGSVAIWTPLKESFAYVPSSYLVSIPIPLPIQLKWANVYFLQRVKKELERGKEGVHSGCVSCNGKLKGIEG